MPPVNNRSCEPNVSSEWPPFALCRIVATSFVTTSPSLGPWSYRADFDWTIEARSPFKGQLVYNPRECAQASP